MRISRSRERSTVPPWLVPVVLVSVLSPLATDAYLPALPRIAVELSASVPAVQTTLAAFVLAFAGGQLIGGPLSDRLGRRAVLVVGTILFAAGSAACAVAPDVTLLDTARVLEGAGAGAAVATARGVVADRSEGVLLARRLGLLFTALVLAPIVAPGLGSVVTALGGWRSVFGVLAVSGALMAVLAALLVPGRGMSAPRGRTVLAGFGAVLHDGGYRRWLLASCCSAIGGFSYVALSPFVLQTQLGLSSAAFAAVFTSNAVGLTLASLVFRRLTGRVDLRTLILLGTAAGAVTGGALIAIAALPAPDPTTVLPLLTATVAVSGLFIPATTVLLQEAGRAAPATAGAIQGASNYAVGAIAAPVLTAIGGPTLLLLATAITTTAAAQFAVAATASRTRVTDTRRRASRAAAIETK